MAPSLQHLKLECTCCAAQAIWLIQVSPPFNAASRFANSELGVTRQCSCPILKLSRVSASCSMAFGQPNIWLSGNLSSADTLPVQLVQPPLSPQTHPHPCCSCAAAFPHEVLPFVICMVAYFATFNYDNQVFIQSSMCLVSCIVNTMSLNVRC